MFLRNSQGAHVCGFKFCSPFYAEASPNPEIAEKLSQQMPNFLYLNFDRQYVLAALEYLEPGHQRLLFHAAHGLASFRDEYCMKVFEQLEKEGTPT